MTKVFQDVDVAIIGAGLSGISFAVALRRQFPHTTFTILEKADDLGGTWRDNVYPGCASDARIHIYSLSSEQYPDWPHTHAFAPDILAYWRRIAERHHLIPHIRYNTFVQGAEWDNLSQSWAVHGQDWHFRARVVISAIGALEIPHIPKTPGLDQFKGEAFHSARWKSDVDLAHKRIAVVGNGASAAQFVPLISQDKTVHVTQFCRSPKWYWSVSRGPIAERTKWIFRHVPWAQRFYRAYWFLLSEVFWYMFSHDQERTRERITKWMKENVPEKYLDRMIPDFPVGCKRTVFDVGYVRSLNRTNIHLNFEPIERYTKDGIVTTDGEHHPFDVVVFATGFVVHTYPLAIKGVSGQTVQEYFDSVGGAQAYRATAFPGFPNFFTMLGPNAATGHASAVFGVEVQTNYILTLLRPILSPNPTLSSLMPTHEATEVYNTRLQGWLSKSVWTGCHSWYRQDGTGKVLSVFPGPMMLYWWWMRKPIWKDYEVVRTREDGYEWLTSRLMVFVAVLASAVVAWRLF